ncbi:GNAT family N-acetyltransferase [Flavisphingomonas formosensis]|uniref:GNAT family N-acetyltransferase n=1 Tax=Flavisphingomonas formosensis TaxID=861534 RepID=UPI0012F8580B|nr:GNAT family N-acetyltransferase [Sphingomonas formosensis]
MSGADLIVRPAIAGRDALAISQIYSHHVLHGTGTFEEEPPSAGAIADRMEAVIARGWPWLVAEADHVIAGYAYCAQFRDRAAYRYACEDSVYVREDWFGRGVGRALLGALIVSAGDHGFRRMFAVIGDSANRGSIALHERLGFSHAGILHDAGHKFGRDLDVVFMERAV